MLISYCIQTIVIHQYFHMVYRVGMHVCFFLSLAINGHALGMGRW